MQFKSRGVSEYNLGWIAAIRSYHFYFTFTLTYPNVQVQVLSTSLYVLSYELQKCHGINQDVTFSARKRERGIPTPHSRTGLTMHSVTRNPYMSQ